MALYTLGDTHLCGAVPKPMSVFGARWTDHTEKIRARWSSLVTPDDTVVIPGDFSWAMTLDEVGVDFRFLDSLPGKKLLSKGNHDYWWTTGAKMKRCLAQNGVTTVDFLHNNAFLVDGFAVAGSRGWFIEGKLQADIFDTDYDKLVNRECERIRFSLTEAERLKNGCHIPTVLFLHFPPVFADFRCEPILDVIAEFSVRDVFYGHIHGNYTVPATLEERGTRFSLVSADYVNFTPQRIFL